MLYDDEYADVLAYILSLNRHPAGKTQLTAEETRLANIVISH